MDHRDELLKNSWEGEVVGQSFFRALVEEMPSERPMWETLAELEGAMGGLVESVAVRHGLEIDRGALESTGISFAKSAPAGDRDALFKELLAVVAEFLKTYEELAGLLAGDEAWLGRELIAHEQALAFYVEQALAGEQGGDIKVLEFLGRHGSEIPAEA
ncbi:MAG TPA: hypothetical protein VN719_04370 [Gemmatimonadales bacterium]|nr:hypothetical protein [Gemmatimonadales bacterium]